MKSTTLLTTISLISVATALSAVTVDFEDLTVPASGYYNGSDEAGSFTSDGVSFGITYNSSYDSWYGIAYANLGWKFASAGDFTDQYYLAASSDLLATALNTISNNYAVAYDPGTLYGGSYPLITLPDNLNAPISMDIGNNIYAWATIMYGDSYGFTYPFAKDSWFNVTITGYDTNGNETGSTVVYLADYRYDNSGSYHALANEFQTVDLTPLGNGVKTIQFVVGSSDSGAYGINTPTYFAFDDLTVDGHLWPATETWIDTWYGSVYAYQQDDGWIYSAENHCYQYATGDAANTWIYDPIIGWYWTSSAKYPYIYISSLDTWAYFFEDNGTTSVNREYCIWNEDLRNFVYNYPYAYACELNTSN